jgi:hypothetical protein
MFCGSILALVCAVVLVFAGSRLLFVVTALTTADPGLNNDLNVARIAAIGLGIALALIVLALMMAMPERPISGTGRLGMISAGVLVLLVGLLVFTAFDGAAGDLADLEEMGRLVAGHDQLAGDLEQIVDDHNGSVTSAFGLLFGAVLVLSLSLWSLFWSYAPADAADRLARPTALCGTAGALLWASLLAGATFTGAAALETAPPHSSPAFEAALEQVSLTLLAVRGAAIGVGLLGLSLVMFGVRFRPQTP